MKVFAQVSYRTAGYDHDVENVKSLTDEKYEVEGISMGQSHTTVFLKGKRLPYNSVNFRFYDEDGLELDIYSMTEFNPYL